MKKILSALFFGLLSLAASAQMHTDQNGIKTTVTNVMTAQDNQPRRYELATVGFNSFHWQSGGTIILELFDVYFNTGYEKYIVEVGFYHGANTGTPQLRLIESFGVFHGARVILGNAYEKGISYADHPNKALPIYLDIKDYARYRVRITYMQNRVEEITSMDQISIAENPVGMLTEDFTAPVMPDDDFVSSGLLKVSGNGNHYFQNGNVGIGTTQPDAKLSVKGKIHAEEIKVDLNIPGPDYVFNNDYKLLSLAETDAYIQAHRHLPDVPSALEMKNNGINVSEMQMKLLQKIEELTLHTIQQDQKINRLIEIIERNHLK